MRKGAGVHGADCVWGGQSQGRVGAEVACGRRETTIGQEDKGNAMEAGSDPVQEPQHAQGFLAYGMRYAWAEAEPAKSENGSVCRASVTVRDCVVLPLSYE